MQNAFAASPPRRSERGGDPASISSRALTRSCGAPAISAAPRWAGYSLVVDRAAHPAGDRGKAGETLLERWVGHEDLGPGLLPAGGDDEERVHAGHLAQVLLRDLRDPARDLLEGGHQVLGGA